MFTSNNSLNHTLQFYKLVVYRLVKLRAMARAPTLELGQTSENENEISEDEGHQGPGLTRVKQRDLRNGQARGRGRGKGRGRGRGKKNVEVEDLEDVEDEELPEAPTVKPPKVVKPKAKPKAKAKGRAAKKTLEASGSGESKTESKKKRNSSSKAEKTDLEKESEKQKKKRKEFAVVGIPVDERPELKTFLCLYHCIF